MKKIIFKGCGTAIITPFNEQGVNFDEFKKLIEDQIKNSIDAIIVCGTTGESSTMTNEEKRETIKFVVDTVNKRVPVIAGTGGNNTSAVIEITRYAESVGADGALLVTPYYNKTTQAGLVAHYTAIAKETSLPIILYNVPSRTGLNITPATYKELSKIENIVAVKEASGDLSQIAEIANMCGDDLYIYSGNDDQITPILALGGIGVISVLSNIAPQFTHDMVRDFLNGETNRSIKAQVDCIKLVKALFSETNPIPVKAALNIMGYEMGIPRLPLVDMSDIGKEKLRSELLAFKLIK